MMRFRSVLQAVGPRVQFALRAGVAVLVATSAAGAQSGKWTIDAKPTFILGTPGDGPTAEFAFVNGATMLPDGNIMVSDRSDYSMLIVAPDGKIVKKFGRKGAGPGELTNSFFSWRCGKHVFIGNNAGATLSVFALDGSFVRSSRFGAGHSKQGPYRTSCNRNELFAHYGWDSSKDNKSGATYRSQVPVWVTPGDSSRGTLIATVKGSERWATSFLPLGRETRVAIGSDRVYVGEADAYEIKVFALNGKPLPAIKKSTREVAVTKQDRTREVDRIIATMGEKYRKGIEAQYADSPIPKTLPPYRELVVDADDNLWVRDYARTGANNVTWTAFNKDGKQLSEVLLPDALEVYEIGKDYVLGRYIDDNAGAPEVRKYRLIKK